ncbi:MAG: hypothetical protein GX025_01335 [Clostridiales bacterium]|nr:hypothetical protein [Clostridiales bacterium]
MKKTLKSTILLILAFAMFIHLPAAFAEARTFPDVKNGDWYYDSVTKLTQLEVINGMDDGYFHPDQNVTRGEFIKMLTIASEYLFSTTPSKGIHWSESYWNALNEAGVLEAMQMVGNKQSAYPLIPLDKSELDKPIFRYEMAYLINRVLYTVYYENQMELKSSGDSYGNYISDYNDMSMSYRASVEQVYSKGILTGYDDGSFQGWNPLSRAEAATVIHRLLWNSQRKVQSFAAEVETPTVDPSFTSFAFQYRDLTNAQRRQMLFGNPNKTYFTSAADASGYIVDISVPIWKLNTSTGQKTSSTAYLQVHRLVEKEVKAIFNEIYNSPERFPINAIGGARYTDTMRHSWGCAIDINPNENYYLHYASGQKVGTLWEPGVNPFSITPNGSVVRAFARYGWGWGGSGWSTAVDYMHFSILASGG